MTPHHGAFAAPGKHRDRPRDDRHCERSEAIQGAGPMHQPAVYIMANRRNGTLYTGVTSDLSRRVYEHRQGSVAGFTARYGCKRLVWYERYELMTDAIAREKQVKGGSRGQKIALLEKINPDWRDLYEGLA
jgi:putative endonuclease